MAKQKRKAIIDDGMNPELVQGADFEGIFQIPKIAPPKHILLPEQITPFSICRLQMYTVTELLVIGHNAKEYMLSLKYVGELLKPIQHQYFLRKSHF
jgi:hypothetical protein